MQSGVLPWRRKWRWVLGRARGTWVVPWRARRGERRAALHGHPSPSRERTHTTDRSCPSRATTAAAAAVKSWHSAGRAHSEGMWLASFHSWTLRGDAAVGHSVGSSGSSPGRIPAAAVAPSRSPLTPAPTASPAATDAYRLYAATNLVTLGTGGASSTLAQSGADEMMGILHGARGGRCLRLCGPQTRRCCGVAWVRDKDGGSGRGSGPPRATGARVRDLLRRIRDCYVAVDLTVRAERP